MRHVTNDEILNRAKSVPSYTDNSELVAELARRFASLNAEVGGLEEDEVAVAMTFYAHRRQFADVIQGLLDWIRSEYSWRDIELPPEYSTAERALKDIPQ